MKTEIFFSFFFCYFLQLSDWAAADDKNILSMQIALDTIATKLEALEDKLDGLELDRHRGEAALKLVGRIGRKSYYTNDGMLLTWTEGVKFCHIHGLRIASVPFGAVGRAVQSLFIASGFDQNYTTNSDLWFGVLHVGSGTDFYWVSTGIQTGYFSKHAEPTRYCWSIRPIGDILFSICTNMRHVLCESLEVSISRVGDVEGDRMDVKRSVPSLKALGRIGKKSYYWSGGLEMTWMEGLNFCELHDLQFASIQHGVQQLLVQSLFKTSGYVPNTPLEFWVGGVRVGLGTEFYWLTSGTRIDEENFGKNAGPNEYCVSVQYSYPERTSTYNIHECTRKLQVLCENLDV